ncbi:MAG TPA: hypothetical protein P5307_06710 [Pirellulaceae bacterium]|nr:hypothetical protein [Planctomycetaceae bacterium]HRX78735.1 hypothetical protein [Pirellulaceae bacterium]
MFPLSDGKLQQSIAEDSTPTTPPPCQTIEAIFKSFFDSIPEGNLEATTLDGMRSKPFSMKTLPPIGKLAEDRTTIVRKVSRAAMLARWSRSPRNWNNNFVLQREALAPFNSVVSHNYAILTP